MRPALRIAVAVLTAGQLVAAHAQAPANAVGRGAIFALAFSPDGKKLAIGSVGRVLIVETGNWNPVTTITDVDESVRALAWSPDGSQLAIASGLAARSGRVTLWDAGTGSARSLPAAEDMVEAVSWGADGKSLITGADDSKVRLYTALPDTKCKVLDQHNGRVLAVGLPAGQGRFFVSGAADRLVKVWDRGTVESVVNFDQSEDAVTAVLLLPDGQQCVGASLDGKLRWWRAGYDEREKAFYGYVIRTVEANPGGVLALAAATKGERLATGGMDGRVCVWHMNTGGLLHAFTDLGCPVYAVALSPDGRTVVGGGRSGVALVWDAEGQKLLDTIVSPPAPASKPAAKGTAR